MVAQLGFNPDHEAPMGRRHYIDAYAFDENAQRYPEHYIINVAYPDSEADLYDQDAHASKCFLPPPWTYRRKS